MQHVGAHLDVEQDLGRDSVRCPPGQPVLGIDPDLQMDEAGCQRRRHAMHHPAVGLPVAAGDQRGALGQFVLADLAVEDQLIQRRLHHRHRGRQLFEVDEPAAADRPWAAGRPVAPSGCGRRRRATGCRGDPRGRAASARTSTYWRPASVATCWAMALLAAPGGPHTRVGWRASTRSARVAASSLGRSV